MTTQATPVDYESGWDSHVDQLRSAVAAVAVSYGGGDQELVKPCRAVYVGGAGNLTCRLVGDKADVVFTGLTAGVIYQLAIITVKQSGTSITNSLLLF